MKPKPLSAEQVVAWSTAWSTAVSQNSALERYDSLFATGVELDDGLAVENATNACSFLSVVLGDLIMSSMKDPVTDSGEFRANIISNVTRLQTFLAILIYTETLTSCTSYR